MAIYYVFGKRGTIFEILSPDNFLRIDIRVLHLATNTLIPYFVKLKKMLLISICKPVLITT